MLSNRALFLKHLANTTEEPLSLEISRSKGIYLYDEKGNSYMDLIAGICVSNLGHHHPKIVEAVQKQAATYMHTLVYGEMILAPQVKLAALLAENLPDSLDSVYFGTSGTEAVEGAMKLAKRYTGRQQIISCKDAYHGSTQGAMSLMSSSYFKDAFEPLLPNVKHIEYNNCDDFVHITEKTACVILETIQGEAGVILPIDNYLKKLRAHCDKVGALLVFDEIQVGMGRTGSLFAFEAYGVTPDIVTLAKALGGGMPLSAFVASKEVMKSLTHNPALGHITTFGGHPVSCAAGLKNLEILLEEPEILASVEEKGALFQELLKHEAIEEIRGKGLLIAVQVKDFDFMLKVLECCLKNGVLSDWFLFNDSCFRIAPPLTISTDEIRTACKIILKALDDAVKS
jgi:acetylornithine/N-succinyldiaminopimelate aminotransferase